jgi:thiol:disulfide interchange protein
MSVIALLCWIATVFFGLYLLAVWLIENDVTERGATASRLPAPVIGGHALLALAGLGFWVIHLLSGSNRWGWLALATLGVIIVLGLTMLTRWIPVHRGFRESGAEAAGFPAERAFPVPVVASHGLLAFTTFALVLLTLLHGG